MDRFQGPITLAAAGTTGNNTSASVEVIQAYSSPQTYEPSAPLGGVAFQFVVEAVGGTPTVTYFFEGSLDNANFYSVFAFTDATNTAAAATGTVTAAGAKAWFLDPSSARGSRRYKYYRVRTTSNTNVTYRAEMYLYPAVI